MSDESKVRVIYSKPERLYGNHRFDLRAGIIHSVDNAKKIVSEFSFSNEKIANGRNLVIPFWGGNDPIYLEWAVPQDRRLTGSDIYKTSTIMKIEFSLPHFIHLATQREDILGMMPMDKLAEGELGRYAVQSRAYDINILARDGIAILV